MKNHLRNSRGRVGVAAAASLIGVIAAAVVQAQPPRGDRDGQSVGGVDAAINRLMAYDADKDGKLSKAEITDNRLLPLWQRCDANNDGIVTKDELTAQLAKGAGPANRTGNPGPANGPGPGGGPPGRGPGGPPPGPGQILPPFVQDDLKLTEVQRIQIQELQKEVDARLAKILTPEQLQQLQQPRGRGPGGPGGGGPGPGPGGRPPRQ